MAEVYVNNIWTEGKVEEEPMVGWEKAQRV